MERLSSGAIYIPQKYQVNGSVLAHKNTKIVLDLVQLPA